MDWIMPDWAGPLLALTAILALLYVAFVRNRRSDPSGQRDEDSASAEHHTHHVD